MGIYGQDWASYQPAQPDTTGLAFAIVKVTEGLGYTSPVWQAQRDHARAAGLVVGYYHYPHMANDPAAEADRFLALAQPQAGELLVLDWEGYDAANTGVPRATQLAYKEAWLRHVKAAQPHLPVGMYCNTDYWRNVDTTGFYQDFLWIAADGPMGQPSISADWLIHQYGESDGVDLDYCRLGSVEELRAWALAFQPPPKPSPAPAPAAGSTPRGDEVTSLPIPFGFAFDAAGTLSDKTKLLVTPVPVLSGPRIAYRNVDLSLGCDMGNVRVRIAVHNATTGWSRIWKVDVKSEEQRYPIWLQAGDDKISIGRMPASATDTDGADVPGSLLLEPIPA